MLDRISGPHFTFIDPRYHNNSKEIVKRARTLVALFEKEGIDRSKIVITISSTEAGVWATRILSTIDGIQVNLILVSDFVHATICAEAGAAYLTFNLSSVSAARLFLTMPPRN
jgi:transaldolase